MSGTWTTKQFMDGTGALFSLRLWDIDGAGGSGFEFAHAEDPDNLAQYEAVAAGQTDQVLGATGAAGDFLKSVIIVPGTTSPGTVQIKDGAGSAITIFTGGATSVADLRPITVTLGLKSTSGAWKLTTGTNVSALGVGRFT